MDCAKVRASLMDEPEDGPEAHVARVREVVGSLPGEEVRRLAGDATTAEARARIARCLLYLHPAIDSVEVTDPGTSVSYRVEETGHWHNLLLGRESGR